MKKINPFMLGLKESIKVTNRYISAALVACLLPAPAQANDRDLRGTPVPASGCIEVASSNLASRPFANGALMLSSSPSGPQTLSLRCPLPVNNIELSGITNDNDITKIRVHYLDNDGLGNRAGMSVQLVRTEVSSSEPLGFSAVVVCQWGSN